MLRAEGWHTRLCVSNIIMVAVVSEKKYICRIARFNALGARYAIIKFKQGDDFIFPQTIYYILYVLVRVYKYILFKRSKTVEMPSATPRPIEQRRGKLSLEFFLTSATPLAVVKLELLGGGWLWPGGSEVYRYRHHHHHHQLQWIFNVDTSSEESARATYLFFSLYIRK